MDLARYLPLSNRPRSDESSVADDRSALATVVEAAAAAVASRDDRAIVFQRFLEGAGLAPDDGASSSSESIRTGPRRRPKDLERAVRSYLSLIDDLQVEATLDPIILGRVALHASTTASFDRRAAIAGHTVRASDSEWQLGRGPVLEASAADIVRFLLALSDEPPRRQPPAVSAPTTPDTTI